MRKFKIFLIILAIFISTIAGVLGFTYLLLTGPFGPPKHVSLSVIVCSGNATNVIKEPYFWYHPNSTGKRIANVTLIMPIIYIKGKPFYDYVRIKGWDYEIIKTKYGRMIKLHTSELSGLKVVCNDRITDIPVVEINREVKIEPITIKDENVSCSYPIIRTINYTAPFYTSHNLTVVISMSVCSGISLFEPIYNGKKYCGCRIDHIVAIGRGWIYGNGTAKIEMYPRKHWYDL